MITLFRFENIAIIEVVNLGDAMKFLQVQLLTSNVARSGHVGGK